MTSTFENLFEEKIRAELEKIKNARKIILLITSIIIAVTLISFSIISMSHSNLSSSDASSILSVIIITTGILIAINFLIFKIKRESIFYTRILPLIIHFINPNLGYSHTRHITEREYKISGLQSTRYNEFKGKDLIEGEYKGVHIRFSYLEIIRNETRTEKGFDDEYHRVTKRIPVFNGLFFIADLNKKFKGRVVIHPKRVHLFKSAQRVILENPDFNSMFDVYSNDQITARYVLSTSLIERIIKLKRIFGRRVIRIAFINSKLYLTIEKLDPIPPLGIIHNLNNINLYKHYARSIYNILQIVDHLNLHLNIW